MAKKSNIMELYHPSIESEDVVPFKFKFENSGGYETWEVWSNGKERSDHKPKGEFSGVISKGHVLKVIFKVWDGGYNIKYTCTSDGKDMKDLANPSPISGSAMGAAAKKEEINIQF